MSATSVECAPMHAPGRGCALALVAVFGTLAGCVELPVPTRTPYAAAPRSSSTPWSPPPAVTAQRPRTLAAHFAFNRKLQEVAFVVSRRYCGLDPSRARVAAARFSLESATVVEEAVDARLQRGLATRPDLLLARQGRARAAFEVADALGAVSDAEAALADSLGIPPTWLMRVADLSAVPLPTELAESVDAIIDSALARRPDLASRLASLRAREADERRARAEFWPRLSLSGSVGQNVQRYRVGPPFGTFTTNET